MAIPPDQIIEPELSYKIIGAAFNVHNKLGPGLAEKDYQQALSAELKSMDVVFEREKFVLLADSGAYNIKRYIDFLVGGKVVVELKVVHKLGYSHVRQILAYLRASGLKLGILVYFTADGVKYRRVLNPDI